MARARSALILVLVLTAALAAATSATAQAPRPGEVIAQGVSAAGVDLSGATLTIAGGPVEGAPHDEAESRRHRACGRQDRADGGRRREARLRRPAHRAPRPLRGPQGRPGPAGGRRPRAVACAAARPDVRPAGRPRDAPGAAQRPGADHRPQDLPHAPPAQARRSTRPPSRPAIDAALDQPRASRVFRPERTVRVPAEINANDLARVYGTILTVDRTNFKLRLFKGLKWRKTYPIAIGAAGHDTPSGTYTIANKQVNPAWHVPNSPWAGDLQGQVIPGGAPNNPLKARWLGIADGVGIHGTAESWSIGSRASHGCIRMHVPDVIDLYPRVPVGSKVLIK